MKTDYSESNAQFSEQAHLAAQTQIYSKLFIGMKLEFVSTLLSMGEANAILDGQMGVDRIIKVYSENHKSPIEFTSQERFRRPKFSKYKDLTITEWSHSSNMPSELYKIKSGLFVYGYFDPDSNLFIDWIVVDTTSMLYNLVTRRLRFTTGTNTRSNQTFITLNFEDLEVSGSVLCKMQNQLNNEQSKFRS